MESVTKILDPLMQCHMLSIARQKATMIPVNSQHINLDFKELQTRTQTHEKI